jgi:hypothetical protein
MQSSIVVRSGTAQTLRAICPSAPVVRSLPPTCSFRGFLGYAKYYLTDVLAAMYWANQVRPA